MYKRRLTTYTVQMWTVSSLQWMSDPSFFSFNLVWKSVVYVQNSMYISISFCNDIWLPYSPAEGPNSGICDVLVDNMCPRWVWCKMVIKPLGQFASPSQHTKTLQMSWQTISCKLQYMLFIYKLLHLSTTSFKQGKHHMFFTISHPFPRSQISECLYVQWVCFQNKQP
jgi:hypothetical protein